LSTKTKADSLKSAEYYSLRKLLKSLLFVAIFYLFSFSKINLILNYDYLIKKKSKILNKKQNKSQFMELVKFKSHLTKVMYIN